MNRPAHPVVMGGDPGSASGAEAADATPKALRGPQSGMACDCTCAESTGARAEDWAGTPTTHARGKMRISRATFKEYFMCKREKTRLPAGACACCTCLRARLFLHTVSYQLRRRKAPL